MFQTIKIIKDKQSDNFMMLIMMFWNYYQRFCKKWPQNFFSSNKLHKRVLKNAEFYADPNFKNVPAPIMQPSKCYQLIICFFYSILLPSAHIRILFSDVFQLHLCSLLDAASLWFVSSIPSSFHLLIWWFCFRTCSSSTYAASQIICFFNSIVFPIRQAAVPPNPLFRSAALPSSQLITTNWLGLSLTLYSLFPGEICVFMW